MIKHWADTSALLHWNLGETSVGISPLTLAELEHIKTNERESQDTKYQAREAILKIINTNAFIPVLVSNTKIDRLLKKYNFLSNINDHRILLAAEITAKE